jgi:transglutaminase-like putative cysteine protease
MTAARSPVEDRPLWLGTRCEIRFELERPTPFLLMLRPRSGLHQWIAQETYRLEPTPAVTEFTDPFGNLVQRLTAPRGTFRIESAAEVRTDQELRTSPGARFVPVQALPHEVLTFLLPSRYCESERFIDMAWSIVDGARPGYDQVERISAWIRANVRFNPDSPHFQQSAVDINGNREGVCRELAHLGIALCRALCIPARMVVGYLHRLEPMDLHAWFEAFVGDGWHTFDPTQAERRGGRVTVAVGRDAADVALYTQFGPAVSPTRMRVSVEPLGER